MFTSSRLRTDRQQRKKGRAVPAAPLFFLNFDGLPILFADAICQERGKGLDVVIDAGLFEGGHVFIAAVDGDDGPGVASRGQHRVHEKAAHAAVAVHIGVDIDKYPVAEHRSDCCVFFLAQMVE